MKILNDDGTRTTKRTLTLGVRLLCFPSLNCLDVQYGDLAGLFSRDCGQISPDGHIEEECYSVSDTESIFSPSAMLSARFSVTSSFMDSLNLEKCRSTEQE